MKLVMLDDHRLFGESLKRVLLEHEAVETCVFCSDEVSLIKEMKREDYDIVLLDINLKDAAERTGFDVLTALKQKHPQQRIVILSSYDMPLYEKKALENGASDFINKSIEVEDLIQRLQMVLEGKVKPVRDQQVEQLTDREVEILKEICKGKIKKELAKELYISERTLYNHIQNIYDKLGVSNTVEAYNKAIECGYIDPLM